MSLGVSGDGGSTAIPGTTNGGPTVDVRLLALVGDKGEPPIRGGSAASCDSCNAAKFASELLNLFVFPRVKRFRKPPCES